MFSIITAVVILIVGIIIFVIGIKKKMILFGLSE